MPSLADAFTTEDIREQRDQEWALSPRQARRKHEQSARHVERYGADHFAITEVTRAWAEHNAECGCEPTDDERRALFEAQDAARAEAIRPIEVSA